jgi:hypothetical protein
VPTTPEPEPVSTEGSVAANALGSSAGALATTQFESTEPIVATPPAIPTAPKISAPAKSVVRSSSRRKVVRNKSTRRVTPRRTPARSSVRSKGIKVYN